MNKIISIVVIFFIFTSSTFSYTPISSDKTLIDNFNKKIYKIYESNPNKIKILEDKIEILKKSGKISSRINYILDEMLLYIKNIKTLEFLLDEKEEVSNNSNVENYTNNETITSSNWDIKDFKNVYEVGPNKKYSNLNEIPWESLTKSSIIKIYWREKPYYEKFVVNVTGTKEEPVVILGVPNEKGQLPVISGKNATTREKLDYRNENRSVIKIGGTSYPENENPAYIFIENLDIKESHSNYSFTDDRGNKQNYIKNAAGIYIEYGENITIKNCEIHLNGNGIFTTHFTKDIHIVGNYIYDNGNIGSIYEHNTYTESNGIIYENNRFGKLIKGAKGNNLKDRSSGTIIRYNFIEGGNRQLDLVDSGYEEITKSDNYNKTYVYGNILIEPSDDNGNSQFIHYGGDSGKTNNYRKGTIYLYNNTFVSYRENNPTLIRMSENTTKAQIINNIFKLKSSNQKLAISDGKGQITLNNNYLPISWKNTFESQFNGIIKENNNLTGNNPGFVDFTNMDFNISLNSPVKNKALDLGNKVDFLKVKYEYLKHRAVIERKTLNNIGAFEFSN